MDIPNYTLIKKLGEGAMADVYLAEHKRNRRKAAIKVLKHTTQVSASDVEQLFLREGEVLASFSDRNIVAIYDNDKIGDIAYIAMELLTGGTLFDRMQAGPITVGEAVGFIVQIASALNTAHLVGVIHRDLKPANIMLRDETTPVLTDFGAARLLDKSTIYGKDGSVIGTPFYMSPEQIQGLTLDGRSDLYALGVLFHELLTGHLPYRGQTAQEIGMQHLFAPVPKLPAGMEMLQPVLERMLAKQPDERYPNTIAVADALRTTFLTDEALRKKVVFEPSSAWSSQLRALGFALDTAQRNEVRIAQGDALKAAGPPTQPPASAPPVSRQLPPVQPPVPPPAATPLPAAPGPTADAARGPPARVQPAPPPVLAAPPVQPSAQQRPAKSSATNTILIVVAVLVVLLVAGVTIAFWPDDAKDSGTDSSEPAVTPAPDTDSDGEQDSGGDSDATPETDDTSSGSNTTTPSAVSAGASFADSLSEGGSGPAMVQIAAGSFVMGSAEGERDRDGDEGPPHTVQISPFAIGRSEVTVEEFRAFVQSTSYVTDAERNVDLPDELEAGYKGPNSGCNTIASVDKFEFGWRTGKSWRSPGYKQTDHFPAGCLSWNDAQAYVTWLAGQTGAAYRLPSEAELEFVIRAGTSTPYVWGSDPNGGCAYSNGADATPFPDGGLLTPRSTCKDGQLFAAAVGSFPANALGLYDTVGNVWEWAEDCAHASYANAPTDGSAWTSNDTTCVSHVMRGGSWANEPKWLRSAHRNWLHNADRKVNYGFRVAKSIGTQ